MAEIQVILFEHIVATVSHSNQIRDVALNSHELSSRTFTTRRINSHSKLISSVEYGKHAHDDVIQKHRLPSPRSCDCHSNACKEASR